MRFDLLRSAALGAALVLAACATAPTSDAPAEAAPAPTAEGFSLSAEPPQATIPFGASSVRSWRYERETDSLLLEARGGKWYRAELFSSCRELDFANAIGFVRDPGGSIDRFSSIVVRDIGLGYRTCQFKSLVEIPDPDKKPDAAEVKPTSTP